MDFSEDPRTAELRVELEDFMASHVYPAEHEFEDIGRGGDAGRRVAAPGGDGGPQGRGAPRAGSGTCSCPTPSTAPG